jgi:hypothetical protein
MEMIVKQKNIERERKNGRKIIKRREGDEGHINK